VAIPAPYLATSQKRRSAVPKRDTADLVFDGVEARDILDCAKVHLRHDKTVPGVLVTKHQKRGAILDKVAHTFAQDGLRASIVQVDGIKGTISAMNPKAFRHPIRMQNSALSLSMCGHRRPEKR